MHRYYNYTVLWLSSISTQKLLLDYRKVFKQLLAMMLPDVQQKNLTDSDIYH